MSDDAVHAKTGKNWKQWFAVLDKAGAKKMSHQEIVKHLNEKHGVGPWWQQMVAVTYEQARGLRDKHQKPQGYEISVSRTLSVPTSTAYSAFANEKDRDAWLKERDVALRTATRNKSLRFTWADGKTNLVVAFISKGEDKCQVVVQHSKIPHAKAAAAMKTFWAKALDRLKGTLEA